MMKNCIAVSAMALLSACASTYVATPYVAGPEPIRTVAVADDSVPENLSALEVASVGSNFGLIGALINAGVQSSRQNALEEALGTISFDAEDALEHYMVDALAEQGMQATLLSGPQRESRVFLADYPDAPQGAQAYVDVVLTNYGYLSAGSGDPWRPTAYALVRLVSVSDGRVLMENQIAYNVMNPARGVITLTPNPDYVFDSRADMVSNPERLADGLRDAMHRIASTAANLMH